MATKLQDLGDKGEEAVRAFVTCPQCNKPQTLKKLTKNFKCVDVICEFCGFLAQVKATKLKNGTTGLPDSVLGGAWQPQHEQILAGIFHALYIVSFDQTEKQVIRIDYIPSHIVQVTPEMFEPRNKLSANAQRAGWQGFTIRLAVVPRIGIQQVYPTQK